MIRSAMLFAMAAALVAGTGFGVKTRAEDPKGGEKARDAKSTDSKSAALTSPLAINFPAEFGLEFDSLKDLGARITRAQDAQDPVALLLLGKELALLEQVSGKKAGIKSDDLTKAGTAAARTRHRPAELRAAAMLTTDEKIKQEFTDLAKKVEDNKDMKDRGIPGYLVVRNNTRDTVHIYINNENVGHITGGGSRSFRVEDDRYNDTTAIYAHDAVKRVHWGPYNIKNPNAGNNHNWTLNP